VRRGLIAGSFVGLVIAGAFLLRPSTEGARPAPAAFVDEARCAGCHAEEAERWRGSPHDRAMELPSPSTVRGDFDDAVFEDTRLLREGDDYFVEVAGRRHRVVYTFGAAPLQQYLLEADGGRLQASAVAWDVDAGKWFRVQDPAVHYLGRYQTWNTMCADCHSTGVDKRYDAETDHFDTRFAQIDVGCQSCHGPGSQHADDPDVALAVRNEVEACAPCHARRAPLTERADPLEPFTDHYRPMTLQPGLYFADGQIRDEVFTYGSFAQSAMHAAGVTCTDCHDPHGATKLASNRTCLTCHGATPPDRFASLAKRKRNLDTPAHHHHAEGSAGAQCTACHMPTRTYMGVDERHDHRFAIPRPDLSAKLGTPDVCTDACHTDRDATWSAEIVRGWGAERRPHFGELFARAQAGNRDVPALTRLAKSDAPAIVRATALEWLAMPPVACDTSLVRDPDPLVRSVAVTCAEALSPTARVKAIGGQLEDASRLVRVETARVLAPVATALRGPQREAYTRAREELTRMYTSQTDRPEGHFNLGLLAEAEGDRDEAARRYKRALEQDPLFRPARVNLYLMQQR
jgi:hypothetical protein